MNYVEIMLDTGQVFKCSSETIDAGNFYSYLFEEAIPNLEERGIDWVELSDGLTVRLSHIVSVRII